MAAAAEFVVVPASPGLHPLLPERVWVGVFEDGQPIRTPPVVTARGARVRFGTTPAAPGVWPLIVTPDAEARQIALTVASAGDTHTATLDVRWPAPGGLVLPVRLEAVAQAGPVAVPIRSDDPPDPEHLQVTASEGEVVAVERTDEGVVATLALDDSPLARIVSVAVRDTRKRDRPTWTTVRVRARPRVPVEAPPASQVRLHVGGRSYGPFTVGASGRVDARIDQYPGEGRVDVSLIDDVGNEASSTLPLATTDRPTLHVVPGARVTPEHAPRQVWVHATQATGRVWTGAPPVCRSPASGALPVVAVVPGLYAVPIDGRMRARAIDKRVECRLEETSASIRVGPVPGVPTQVLLQVWPTELSTDLPVAEVRVAVEDTRGLRLPVGDVVLEADLGQINRVERAPDRLLAEYDGEPAVGAGEDRIRARYVPPVASAPVTGLAMAWRLLGPGRLRVDVETRDRRGRRVRDAAVAVSAGDLPVDGRTGPDGRVSLEVPFPDGSGPVVLVARSEAAALRTLVSRTATETYRVDSRGELPPIEAEQTVQLSPGRVSGISVAFEPPVLRTVRGSVALVIVTLEDRSGRPVLDMEVDLDVTEGEVGPLIPRPDGTLVAEFTPGPSDRAREVTVTARTEALRTTGRLELEPRLGRLLIGPTVGGLSNLGLINTVYGGVDADIRTGLLGETVLVRAGIAGHGVTGSAATGLGPDLVLRGTVVPVTLGLLIRQDRGGVGFWGGAVGAVAWHQVTARFGTDAPVTGTTAITGAGLLGGVGYRLGLGDLVTELRWTYLPGPGGQVGFTGNLGGLSAGVGYRFVY
jgi:hypothetical protein